MNPLYLQCAQAELRLLIFPGTQVRSCSSYLHDVLYHDVYLWLASRVMFLVRLLGSGPRLPCGLMHMGSTSCLGFDLGRPQLGVCFKYGMCSFPRPECAHCHRAVTGPGQADDTRG